jgi:hypothetical protein
MAILNLKWTLILTSLSLMGCGTDSYNAAVPQTSRTEIFTRPAIRKTSLLTLDQVWPLKHQGTYLQKINATFKGQDYVFTVHLILEPQKIEFIAFNDIHGRFYRLIWTPQKMEEESSNDILKAEISEAIITDFLLAYLPLASLKRALNGAIVHEEGNNQQNIRSIESHSVVLRKIYRSTFLGYLWQKVVIDNSQDGYKLDIQTVALS